MSRRLDQGPDLSASENLYVGAVRFFVLDKRTCVCTLCSKRMTHADIASHAGKRHKALSHNVLPGQLGLPGFGVPDVPGDSRSGNC